MVCNDAIVNMPDNNFENGIKPNREQTRDETRHTKSFWSNRNWKKSSESLKRKRWRWRWREAIGVAIGRASNVILIKFECKSF